MTRFSILTTAALAVLPAIVLPAIVLPAIVTHPVAAQDWPQYRGLDQSGSALSHGVLNRETFGLAIDWKRPLGSGYSSIAVSGDQLVTMYTDGTDDLLAAFDSQTGEERWRYRIAEMYAGHTGSDDGPISSPLIFGGAVYGLGPRGQLFAVRFDDGGEIWRRTLDGKTDSSLPHYGFSTIPVVAGNILVVQTGGPDGHSITGFDRHTGEPRWLVGNNPVAYQSPALLELAGRKQVVAINDQVIMGIEPQSGELLWLIDHGMTSPEGLAQPLAIGPDGVLVNSLDEIVKFKITPPAGDIDMTGFKAAEVWRSRALKQAYGNPVLHGRHLYGFSGRFLTCVDVETGDLVWKSRPPGGIGLSVVDDLLVIIGGQGDLVLATATPEGYQERARLDLFAAGSHTPPSFAGGHFYLRDLAEMARVRVTAAPAAPKQAVAERELLGQMATFVPKVEAAENKTALIDEFLKSQGSFPIVEGSGLVHFLYRGETADAALAGGFLPFRGELPMDRIAGTQVFFKSLELDPKAAWEYRFILDFGERPGLDPLNPKSITALYAGPSSVLHMPRWKAPDHLSESTVPAGRLDSFQFHSDLLGKARRIELYTPPDYDDAEARYPLMIVQHGQRALHDARMDRALDQLIAQGTIRPLIVAFVSPRDQLEYVGEAAENLARMMAEELVPHLDQHYRTETDPASRGLLGVLDGAVPSLLAALNSSGTFGKLASQSLVLSPPFDTLIPQRIQEMEKIPLQFYVGWCRQDLKIGTVDAAANGRTVIDALEAKGYEVRHQVSVGAWGWTTWMSHFGEILAGFYPPE